MSGYCAEVSVGLRSLVHRHSAPVPKQWLFTAWRTREPWVREVVHCVPDLAVPIRSGTRHLAAARVGTTDVRPRSLVDLSKVSSECFGPSVLPDAGAVSAPSS